MSPISRSTQCLSFHVVKLVVQFDAWMGFFWLVKAASCILGLVGKSNEMRNELALACFFSHTLVLFFFVCKFVSSVAKMIL